MQEPGPTPPPPPPPSDGSGSDDSGGGLSTGAKIGIALGLAVVALIGVAVIVIAAAGTSVVAAQQERAWQAEVDSAVRNAAIEMETAYVVDGAYPSTVPGVDEVVPDAITVEVVVVTDTALCLEGRHDELPDYVSSYDTRSAGDGNLVGPGIC